MKNLKCNILLIFLILFVGLMACSSPSKPKVKGYIRLDFPTPTYSLSTDSLPFVFDLSNQAKLTWQKNSNQEIFCNIDYPIQNARLYCTYHVISPDKFRIFAEESRRLAYQHTSVATGIKEQLFANVLSKTYGLIYDIQGEVATPIQLALTDSSHYFFNASLYFNSRSNADSIAPSIAYIRKDLLRMINSFTIIKRN